MIKIKLLMGLALGQLFALAQGAFKLPEVSDRAYVGIAAAITGASLAKASGTSDSKAAVAALGLGALSFRLTSHFLKQAPKPVLKQVSEFEELLRVVLPSDDTLLSFITINTFFDTSHGKVYDFEQFLRVQTGSLIRPQMIHIDPQLFVRKWAEKFNYSGDKNFLITLKILNEINKLVFESSSLGDYLKPQIKIYLDDKIETIKRMCNTQIEQEKKMLQDAEKSQRLKLEEGKKTYQDYLYRRFWFRGVALGAALGSVIAATAVGLCRTM